MAKIDLIAAQPYKGRAVGEAFQTSLKNSRTLIADGIATAPGAKKVAAKKAAKRPAKKAAKKATYRTRAMKAKK